MKKFLSLLVLFVFSLSSAFAENLPNIKYNNVKANQKILYDTTSKQWRMCHRNETANCYTKADSFGETSFYLDQNQSFGFGTGCEFEFIANEKLIGYSNSDLKFFEFVFNDGILQKQPLSADDTQKLFPEFRVISLSEFEKNTNALKIKNNGRFLNIILYNDTENKFDGYKFTSGNTALKKYDMQGVLTIYKSGMVQFGKIKDKSAPWFILLVR